MMQIYIYCLSQDLKYIKYKSREQNLLAKLSTKTQITYIIFLKMEAAVTMAKYTKTHR